MSNRERINKYWEEAEKLENSDLSNEIILCLMSAENNADDTKQEDPDSDYWLIYYGSICYTSQFNEKENVREFFKNNGYEW